jgi:hypothetical protein
MAEKYYDDWMKNKTKEEIVKEISELRRNIKKKHQTLQRQLVDTNEMLEKQWKPVSEPLIKLLEEHEEIKLEKNQTNDRKRKYDGEIQEDIPVKQFIPTPEQGEKRKLKVNLPNRDDYESDYEYDDGTLDLPPAKRPAVDKETDDMDYEHEDQENEPQSDGEEMQVEPTVYETSPTAESLLRTPKGRNLAKQFVENTFTGNIAKDYFLKLIRGGKVIDHNYGVRVDGNEWMLGDKRIEIDGDDLIINDVKYTGTRGLYELIFMNSPNPYIYTDEDLRNYATILRDTKVYRVNYSELGRIRSNRGRKYINLIAPIINRGEASGSGIVLNSMRNKIRKMPLQDFIKKENPMATYSNMILPTTGGNGVPLTNNKLEYIYFDDPNELVDRLRLLYGSQEAGNNAHKNEINSIIEELLELEKEGKINV